MRWVAVVLVASSLVGCQGVPVGHYRYRASVEPAELAIGTLALPFAFLGDALAMACLIDSDLLGKALTLISPFHNLWPSTTGPTECAQLKEGVAVSCARREATLAGEASAILALARAQLVEAGFAVEPTPEGGNGWKLRTAWTPEVTTSDATTKNPAVLRRLHVRVYPPERGGDPVRVRARLAVAAVAGELVHPSQFATIRERLAQLEGEKDDAEDDLDDEEGNRIAYWSKGKKGKKEIEDDLEARRAPHRRRAESAASDILEVENELFHARVDATRAELARRSDEPLRVFWDRLTTKFPAR